MSRALDLRVLAELNVGQRIGQCRAAPLNLGAGATPAVLAAYCADFDVDPYVEMFFFPSDTLKLVAFTIHGERLWERDLGPGVVPGMWFCPVLPFDLDGDGIDEIYLVGNRDTQHPLALSAYCLQRLDGRTGRTTGEWPWPAPDGGQPLSHLFRNFLIGGIARRQPVLIGAQGTYGEMRFQAHGRDLEPRWTKVIAADAPGARGSHMCPLVDLDRDGALELLWGERCLRLDTGEELFCADRDSYRGHSDIVQPFWDGERWRIFCCRESDGAVAPRIACYDAAGRRLWGHLDHGHIDMGWVARLADGRQIASAIRIGAKSCGPDGRFHQAVDEFAFDAVTGEPVELDFSTYRTIPVDLDGDGRHELIRGLPSGDGTVLDGDGTPLAELGGAAALACKVNAVAGEQLLIYTADGWLRLYADAAARDSHAALARYTHPFYAANRRLTAVGQNLVNLGGV